MDEPTVVKAESTKRERTSEWFTSKQFQGIIYVSENRYRRLLEDPSNDVSYCVADTERITKFNIKLLTYVFKNHPI